MAFDDTPAPAQARTPHDVDTHVGRRIRARRKELGITQEQLADTLGLTFQQVQKYERGANRVSASKLFAIAHALQVPFGYFVEGLDTEGHASPATRGADQLLADGHGSRLTAAFLQLPDHARRSLAGIAEQLLEAFRLMQARKV